MLQTPFPGTVDQIYNAPQFLLCAVAPLDITCSDFISMEGNVVPALLPGQGTGLGHVHRATPGSHGGVKTSTSYFSINMSSSRFHFTDLLSALQPDLQQSENRCADHFRLLCQIRDSRYFTNFSSGGQTSAAAVAMAGAEDACGYHLFCNQNATLTRPIITGTSTSGPITAAKAAPL